MNEAISESPEAANAIFSNATTGIAAQIKAFVKAQTSVSSGILVQRKDSLSSSIVDIDEKIETTQIRLDAERKRLVSQFTAMEQLISSLKGLDTYLTNLSNMKLGSE
jgi:flagellar hook-associated protein 2